MQGAFQEAGGRTIEVTNRDYQIRGVVNNDNIDSLELMVIGRAPDGKPVQLKDVGYIQVGYDQRRSIADLDGNGEVVGGIVVMEQKQNVLAVTDALVKSSLRSRRRSLPGSRSSRLMTVPISSGARLSTIFSTLISELVIVILVTALFLHNPRTAIAPVAVLLLGVLYTFIPLAAFNQTINLFSLAGLFIAIGEMVDATIVIVENCTRGACGATRRQRRGTSPDYPALDRKRRASAALLAADHPRLVPARLLPGREGGRMFDPLAFSKTFAMAFSTVLTLVLLPIIIVWVFKSGNVKPQTPRELAFVDLYRRGVRGAIRYRYAFLGGQCLSAIAAIVMIERLPQGLHAADGGRLHSLHAHYASRRAGREAGWILQQIDKKLAAFPEVQRVFGKLGRADTATDPAPVSMIETTILLKPQAEWRPGMTKERLVAEMDAAMKFVGFVNMWVQPISARVVMQDTGISTPVGNQDQRQRHCDHRGYRPTDRDRTADVSRHTIGDRRAHLCRAISSMCNSIPLVSRRRRQRRGSDADRALRHRRRQRCRHQGGEFHPGPTERAVFA